MFMKSIMNVAGVFQIDGIGLVVTGTLYENVKVDDGVVILRKDGFTRKSRILDIKWFETSLPTAEAGSDIALVLEGMSKADVAEGDIIGFDEVSTSSLFMRVDDTFLIKGRGVVLDGTVAVGRVSSGDVVRIIRQNAPVLDLVIAAIAKERTIVETASAGEHVGILFEGLSSGQVNIGDVITNR